MREVSRLTDNLRAAILIGGESRRMGEPKTLVRWMNVPMLERVVAVPESLGLPVVFAGEKEVPKSLRRIAKIADAPGLVGPPAGICAAMNWKPDATWLFIPCDMPWWTAEAARWLIDQLDEDCCGIAGKPPDSYRPHPLPCILKPETGPLICKMASTGNYGVGSLLRSFNTRFPEIPTHLADRWRNANTPDDLPT